MASILARGARPKSVLDRAVVEQPEYTHDQLVSATNNEAQKGFRSTQRGGSAAALSAQGLDAEIAGDPVAAQLAYEQADMLRKAAVDSAPRVQSLRDINGVGDAIDFIAGGVPQALTSTAPVIAGALAGRFGGAALSLRSGLGATAAARVGTGGAYVGGAVPAYDMEYNETAGELAQDAEARARMTPQEIKDVASNKALINMALETVGPGAAVNKLFGGAAKGSVIKSGRNAMIGEGATEGVQQAVGDISANYARTGEVDLLSPDEQSIADAVALGAMGGSALSVPSMAGTAMANAGGTMKDVGSAAYNKARELAGSPQAAELKARAQEAAANATVPSAEQAGAAVGKAASKVMDAKESVIDHIKNKVVQGVDPELDSLLAKQTGTTPDEILADDAVRNENARTLAQRYMADPEAPASLRQAAEAMMNDTRTEAWTDFGGAVRQHEAAKKFSVNLDNIGAAFEKAGLTVGKAASDFKAGVDTGRRANAEEVNDPFGDLFAKTMTSLVSPRADATASASVAKIAPAIQKWIANGFAATEEGKMYVPHELSRLGKDPVATVKALHDLMDRQGLLNKFSASRLQVVAKVMEERLDAGVLIENNLLPTAQAEFGFSGADHRDIAAKIESKIVDGTLDVEELKALFGKNTDRVLSAIEKTADLTRGEKQAAEQRVSNSDGDLGDDAEAATEDIGNMTNTFDPNVTTSKVEYHAYNPVSDAPYSWSDDKHIEHANNKIKKATGEGYSHVRPMGIIDAARERYADDTGALAAELERISDTYGRDAKKVNDDYFVLRAESKDQMRDPIDIPGEEFRALTVQSAADKKAGKKSNNTWAIGTGEKNEYGTVEQGVVWLERVTKDGDTKVFATSAAKIIKRAREAKKGGALLGRDNALQDQYDMLRSGIASLMDSRNLEGRHVLSGRLGFIAKQGGAIKWQGEAFEREVEAEDVRSRAERIADSKEQGDGIDMNRAELLNKSGGKHQRRRNEYVIPGAFVMPSGETVKDARGLTNPETRATRQAKVKIDKETGKELNAVRTASERFAYETLPDMTLEELREVYSETTTLIDRAEAIKSQSKSDDIKDTQRSIITSLNARLEALESEATKRSSESDIGSDAKEIATVTVRKIDGIQTETAATRNNKAHIFNSKRKAEEYAGKNDNVVKKNGQWIVERAVGHKVVSAESHLTEGDEMSAAANEREENKVRVRDEKFDGKYGLELQPRESASELRTEREVANLLDLLRKGVPATNAAITKMSAAEKAATAKLLKTMRAAPDDAPMWKGKPPTNRDAFSTRVAAALARLGDTPTDTPPKGTRANKQTAENNLGTTPMTPEQQAKVREDIALRVGAQVKVEFGKIFGAPNDDGVTKELSGEWTEGVIRISINAVNPDQIGAHESMHEFFSNITKSDNKTVARVKDILLNAATSQSVLNQLNRLLDKHPAALAQIKEGSANYQEERLAYAFQFWQAGLLNIGPETRTTFKKVADFLRRVVGMLTNDQKAEQLLEAFNKGEMTTEDAVVKTLLDNVEYRERALKGAAAVMKPVSDAVGKLISPAQDVLMESENPSLVAIAKMFKQPTGEGVAETELEAKQRNMNHYMNNFVTIVKDYDAKDLELAAEYLHAGKVPHNEAARKIYNGVQGMLKDMHKYVVDAGVKRWESGTDGKGGEWVDLGKIKENYFPHAFDISIISADPDKFMADLIRVHRAELEAIAKSSNLEAKAEKADAKQVNVEDIAEAITNRILNSYGQKDLGETESVVGFQPHMRAVNRRTLTWLDTGALGEYMNKDLSDIMTTYIAQAVKRAEYVRRFENGGAKLQRMYSAALEFETVKLINQRYGVDISVPPKTTGESTEVALADRQGSIADAINAKLGANETKVTGADVAALEEEALKLMERPGKAIMALEGTLGYDIDPRTRAISGSVVAYENIRLLSTALFSQMIDPLGIIVRGGDMKHAFAAYSRGVKEVWASWTGKRNENAETQLAEFLGTVESVGYLSTFGQQYSSLFLNKKIRKINDAMFKYNGMEGFNRAARIQATQAAIEFLKRHKNLPDKASKAYLEELNLTPDDITLDADGVLNYADPKIQQAINRWVNGAVLRPNAAHRPVWMSDPHYMIFGHMKQFSYTFHDVILKRVANDAKKFGDLGPMAVVLGTFAPMMIAADAAKALLLTGTSPTWSHDLGSIVEHGVTRAGLLGMYQPVYDSTVGTHGLMSLAGPAAEQVADLFVDPIGQSFENALPGANVLHVIDPAVRGAAEASVEG